MGLSNESSLFGRDQELIKIRQQIAGVRSGSVSRSALVFAGEPGIGKTALARQAAHLFSDDGSAVYWARVPELDQPMVFGAWTGILRQLITKAVSEETDFERVRNLVDSDVSGLVSRSTDDSRDRILLFEEIDQLISVTSMRTPICLIVDDLQWADDASLQLFEYLCSGMGDSRLLIIGTYRTMGRAVGGVLDSTIGKLLGDPNFQQFELSKLSDSDSLELWKNFQSDSTDSGDRQLELANGNPLFLVELARTSSQHDSTDETIPLSVRQAVSRHLSQLSNSCREILTTTALFDSSWEVAEALKVFDNDEVALSAWDEAEAAGLVEVVPGSPGSLAFWHPLVREVLIAGLTAAERSRLHASVAEKLEPSLSKSTSKSEVLANHYVHSIAHTGREPAIKYSLLAGQYALNVHAFATAENHFSKVIELSGDAEHSNEWALASAGIARAISQTRVGADQNESAVHLQNAWDYLVAAGQHDEALDLVAMPLSGGFETRSVHTKLASEAMKFAEPGSIRTGYILVALGRGVFHSSNDYFKALEHITAAIRISESQGDTALKAAALHAAFDVRHFDNRENAEDYELSIDAINAATESDSPHIVADLAMPATMSALLQGDSNAAHRYSDICLAAAERVRNSNSTVYALMAVANTGEITGDFERYFAASDRALRIDPDNTALLTDRVRVLEMLGRVDEVDLLLKSLQKRLPDATGRFDPINIAASFAITSERVPRNADVAQKILDGILRDGESNRRIVAQTHQHLAWIACERQDSESIRNELAWFEANPDIVSSEVALEMTVARLHIEAGDPDRAIQLLEPYYRMMSNAGYVSLRVSIACFLARALIAKQTTEDALRAKSLLDETDEIIREHGLVGMQKSLSAARQLHTEASGKTVRADGLTKRELEILSLVAGGKSNPEIAAQLFISRHTVVSHLSNIFDKVGAENRAQATAYAIGNNIV